MKLCNPGLFLAWGLLITDSVSLLVFGLFWFSVLYDSALEGYLICWHINVHNSSLWSLAFLFSAVMSHFSFLIIFESSFFFLVCLAKRLPILLIFYKNMYFLHSVYFISGMTFISFPLINLGLICSYFFRSLRFKVRSFIWDLSFFLNVDIYCYTLLFSDCFCCISKVVVGCVSIFISQDIFLFPFWFLFFLLICYADVCCLISMYLWILKFSFIVDI